MLKSIGGILLAFTFLFGLGWLFTANNLALNKVFAPKFEQVRRETTEQSQSYVEGQRRILAELRLEYISATPEKKLAIRSFALHQIAGLPDSALTSDIIAFRSELLGN